MTCKLARKKCSMEKNDVCWWGKCGSEIGPKMCYFSIPTNNNNNKKILDIAVLFVK